jgi:hypothetical protein
MFRIPEFYEVEMSFEDAWAMMSRRGQGDCLEGMKSMDRLWSEYINLPYDEQDDDEFYDNWCYEISAYNVVYENMSQLFAPKEVA